MAATYVFKGREYVLTGRSAARTLKSSKELLVYEIRPVGVDPSDKSYNEWVEKSELYVVSGEILDD